MCNITKEFKMRNKSLVSFILIVLVLLGASFFYAQQRQAAPIKIDKLSDRLYQILGGRGANGGFYIGDNGVLVIDTKQTKESVDATLEEIKKITDKPIKYIVNTHSDGDHIAGNQFFPWMLRSLPTKTAAKNSCIRNETESRRFGKIQN